MVRNRHKIKVKRVDLVGDQLELLRASDRYLRGELSKSDFRQLESQYMADYAAASYALGDWWSTISGFFARRKQPASAQTASHPVLEHSA